MNLFLEEKCNFSKYQFINKKKKRTYQIILVNFRNPSSIDAKRTFIQIPYIICKTNINKNIILHIMELYIFPRLISLKDEFLSLFTLIVSNDIVQAILQD